MEVNVIITGGEDLLCDPDMIFMILACDYIMQQTAMYVTSLKTIVEEEVVCTPDPVYKDNLMTDVLQAMASMSVAFPFNRAVFPLVGEGYLFVDL